MQIKQTQYVVHRWPCAGYDSKPCPNNTMLDDIISARKKRCNECQHENIKLRLRNAYHDKVRRMKLEKFLEGNV